ncbi:MAG: hypothetical protein ACRCWI_08295 [Brevinema sp.]
MKIILWSLIFLGIGSGYAKTADYILMMSIEDRQYFFTSVKEVADAYKKNGRKAKADSFYRSALDIYPIGDMAHQLASQLGVKLDDDKTYSNFIMMGDQELQNKRYKQALSHYLMANELWNSMELYQQIAQVYTALNNRDQSSYYENLAQGLANEVLTPEMQTEALNTMLEAEYQETIN